MTLPIAILAGGLATRMRPLTQRIPKVLLEVAGKPFAVHQLELLRENGFRDVVFCIGHLGEMVERELGDGSQLGMSIRYSHDGDRLVGTGGALIRALPLLDDPFLVIYGDSYLDCDYAGAEHAFVDSGKLGLMTVLRNEGRWDSSNIVYRDGAIIRYDKKNRTDDMHHIDYGLGGLHHRALDGYPRDASVDLADVYADLVARHELSAFEVTQRFYEIGSPDGLREFEEYLSGRQGASRRAEDAP